MTSFANLYRRVVALPIGALLCAGLVSADQSGDIQPLDCVINPSVVADLGSGVPGIISSVAVDRSDFVESGEVVAELESSVEALALELARARAEMDAEVDLRRVSAAFGNRQNKRVEDLYRRKVISTNDFDERQTEAKLAGLQLRQALENQQLARLEHQRAEKVLHRRTIESPITGVVMERFKSVGEYVEDQPVVRVAQLDPLYVEVFVPVEHLGKVRKGMRAEVTAEALGDVGWTAAVSRVDRVADVASGTYGVRLTLPNPDYKVPAGLRCRVSFIVGAEPPLVDDWPPRQAAEAATAQAELPNPTEVALLDPVGEAGAAVSPAVDDSPADPPAADDDRVDAQDAATARDEPVTAAPSVPAQQLTEVAELPRCQWAGPFAHKDAAERAAGALRDGGMSVTVDTRESVVTVGSTVVSTEQPDRAAAEALVGRLRAVGIHDLYLPNRSRGPLRIALGLYKSRKIANERIDELNAKGFEAELQPWRKRQTQYFLAVRGVPTGAGAALLADLPVPATDGAFENATCDQLAGR